jgi:hypothetical protein
MRVCGMELKGSEARLVLLNGTKANYAHISVKPSKLILADGENPNEVRAFQDALYAFLRENGVEAVAIKKRAGKGEYAGGPVGFKIEAISQLYTDCRIALVPPQTIAAAMRNHPTTLPNNLRGYQEAAFETAYALLP